MACFHERGLLRLLLSEVVYTELINYRRPHTTDGLRFSRKTSAQFCTETIGNYLFFDSNAERRSLSGGDVDRNPP